MWNTIVNEPVGMESFPCQVPEISWAETEDEKNTPANSLLLSNALLRQVLLALGRYWLQQSFFLRPLFPL